MSTIGIERQTRTHLPSSRLRQICLVLALVGSCTNWLGLKTTAQSSAVLNQGKAANASGRITRRSKWMRTITRPI